MTVETVYTALSSGLSLLGICYLIFWRYRSYRIDLFRQQMFELRDELFDFAAEGHIEFDHRAYGMLRSTMNGFIRFGHRFTLWHIVVATLFVKREDVVDFNEVWSEVTADLDPQVKRRLDLYRSRMQEIVIRQIIPSSPEVIIISPFVVVFLIILFLLRRIKSLISPPPQPLEPDWVTLRNKLSSVDSTAFLFGQATEAA